MSTLNFGFNRNVLIEHFVEFGLAGSPDFLLDDGPALKQIGGLLVRIHVQFGDFDLAGVSLATWSTIGPIILHAHTTVALPRCQFTLPAAECKISSQKNHCWNTGQQSITTLSWDPIYWPVFK